MVDAGARRDQQFGFHVIGVQAVPQCAADARAGQTELFGGVDDERQGRCPGIGHAAAHDMVMQVQMAGGDQAQAGMVEQRVQGGAGSLLGTFYGVLIIAVMDEGLRGAAKWGTEHLPFKISHLEYVLLGLLLVVGVWLNSREKTRRPAA